jgi:hypothetical protein
MPMANAKRAVQLLMFAKSYRVRTGNYEFVVQAKSRGEAKYLAFKRAKEVGLYRYEGGFFAFAEGLSIKEASQ